jgi:xyloglucan galactosyltransferase MUR3
MNEKTVLIATWALAWTVAQQAAAMEVTHYPKYTLYALLILCSWLLTACVLCFRSFHSFAAGGLTFLPFSLNYSSFSYAHAIVGGGPASSSSCDGRYVYMLDLPSRFDYLQECVDGSPLLENRYSRCYHMTNAGMGPELNSSDDDGSIVPATGW